MKGRFATGVVGMWCRVSGSRFKPRTRQPRLNTQTQGHGYSEGEREYVADFDNYVSDFYQRARLALEQYVPEIRVSGMYPKSRFWVSARNPGLGFKTFLKFTCWV